MCETVFGGIGLPLMILVNRQAVLRACPYAISIHQHRVDVVVWQAVGRGEVLKPVTWHMRRRCKSQRTGSQKHCDHAYLLHRVLRYSIKSFNSSFVKSFVRPCLSAGLLTVHISSSVRAEPSCR